MSWAVAPDQRGRGIGARMVAKFAERFSEPVRAEVKAGNVASRRIAEGAGMTLVRERDGVLYYRR